MISENCSIHEFVESVKGKETWEVITLAVEVATRADRMYYHTCHDAGEGMHNGLDYSRHLKRLINYLRFEVKPRAARRHGLLPVRGPLGARGLPMPGTPVRSAFFNDSLSPFPGGTPIGPPRSMILAVFPIIPIPTDVIIFLLPLSMHICFSLGPIGSNCIPERKAFAYMLTSKRFAAIDIGSNAVRLLLSEVFETDTGPYFRKISLIRMPIRLGGDVFINGKISRDKADQLLNTIQGFKSLVASYRPLDFRACATSAMRESKTEKIRQRILTQTGVDIEIINGKEEARIIFANNPGAIPPRAAPGFLSMSAAAALKSPFFSTARPYPVRSVSAPSAC
jgi:hypothetical protein